MKITGAADPSDGLLEGSATLLDYSTMNWNVPDCLPSGLTT